jgi:hypothetical protein
LITANGASPVAERARKRRTSRKFADEWQLFTGGVPRFIGEEGASGF